MEPVALQLCPSEAKEADRATAPAETGSDASSAYSYGDICTPRTKAKAVLSLRFDGPLEDLDKVTAEGYFVVFVLLFLLPLLVVPVLSSACFETFLHTGTLCAKERI